MVTSLRHRCNRALYGFAAIGPLMFFPVRDYTQEMVTGITEAVISTVHSVGRILYLRPFNEHVGMSVTAGPNVQDIVRGSRAFCTTSADIGAKVEADFAEAEVRFAHTQRRTSVDFPPFTLAVCIQWRGVEECIHRLIQV